jgi:hypothetical protein
MAEVREVVVNKDYMILGGNMRFKAMLEAGYKEIPVRVVDWSEEKQREFIIKDNVSGGDWDWDLLANEWDNEILQDWGLNLPSYEGVNHIQDDGEYLNDENDYANNNVNQIVLIYDNKEYTEIMGKLSDYFSREENKGKSPSELFKELIQDL